MKIIANCTNSAVTTGKYIILLRANGLDIQIISIGVQFGKDKEGLFCKPFLNSTWLQSKNSPFWNAQNKLVLVI
jgi:hypothetical protein